MKKFSLVLMIVVLCWIAVGFQIPDAVSVTCSTDASNPNVLPGFTVTAGKVIYWRVRAIDPDYGVHGGYVDVVAGTNPTWITFGPRIAPDANQYVFAPKNLDCDGNTVDPNLTFIASRRVTISPPVVISGEYEIRFSTTDANQTSYWRIPFVVSRPPKQGISGDAGAN